MNSSLSPRIAGAAGLALALMMIVAFVLDIAIIGTTGGNPVFSLDNIGPDLLRAGDSLIWRIEAWIYVLMIVPFVVFGLGVLPSLRSERDAGFPTLWLLTTTLFWLFSTLHNAAIVTVLEILLPGYVAGSPASQSIETAARGLLGFGNTLFVPGGGVGTLLFVIGMIAVAQVTFRTRRYARWLGYVALASALLSLVAYLQYLSSSLLLLGLLGYLLYIVWILAVSMQLSRNPAYNVGAG